jgi:solute carrier family 25 protein 38
MATSPYFARVHKHSTNSTNNSSVLPTLTSQGNLLAGATTRVGVGFILNPFSVLKARFEVRVIYFRVLEIIFLIAPSLLFSTIRVTSIPTKVSRELLFPSCV